MSKLFLCLAAAAPLLAQLPSNTVTIIATRSVTVQPDQVVFGLIAGSGETTNLDQIVAALSSLGITSSNLSGTDNNNAPLLDWDFSFTAPVSNLAATVNSLISLQKTIAQNNSGLTLAFTVNGLQVSQQLQQSQLAQTCTDANLISDATAQAQKLAAAANVTLGRIVQLSNEPLQPEFAVAQLVVPARLGAVLTSVPPLLPSTCSLSVQFQLLR